MLKNINDLEKAKFVDTADGPAIRVSGNFAVASLLGDVTYDAFVVSTWGAFGPTEVQYKQGGRLGTTVATLALYYTVDGDLEGAERV